VFAQQQAGRYETLAKQGYGSVQNAQQCSFSESRPGRLRPPVAPL
jgi:hypothetical protein